MDGQWLVEGSGTDLKVLCRDTAGRVIGYALTGAAVNEKVGPEQRVTRPHGLNAIGSGRYAVETCGKIVGRYWRSPREHAILHRVYRSLEPMVPVDCGALSAAGKTARTQKTTNRQRGNYA